MFYWQVQVPTRPYVRTIPDLPSQPGYNNSLDGGDGIQRWTLRDGLAAE